MVAGRPRGRKHWTRAVIVPVQTEYAKFFAGTVPSIGGQLVVICSNHVEAVSGPGAGIAEDDGACVIVIAVAGECPRGRDGGGGSEED